MCVLHLFSPRDEDKRISRDNLRVKCPCAAAFFVRNKLVLQLTQRNASGSLCFRVTSRAAFWLTFTRASVVLEKCPRSVASLRGEIAICLAAAKRREANKNRLAVAFAVVR